MSKTKSKIIIIIVIMVVVAAIVGIILYTSNMDTVDTRNLVRISKDGTDVAVITDAEYVYALLNYMLQVQDTYSITDETAINNFWLTSTNGVTQLEQVKNYTLEQVEFAKIEYLKAIENGVELTKTERNNMEASFDDMEKQFTDAGYDMDEYLVQNFGISFKMYKQISEQALIVSKFETQQINKIDVTDDEVLTFYNDNIDNYYTVTVRHILLYNTDTSGNALDEDALADKLELANELLARINNGEDMGALITEYSEDSYASENNGYYDVTANTGYVEAFQEWTMNSKEGDTAVVESEYGYHVVKTYAVSTYEDKKDVVKTDLKKNKYSAIVYEEWAAEFDVVVYQLVFDSIQPIG